MPPPVAGTITQGFGPTDEPLDGAYGGYPHFNKGIDYGVPIGTPVRNVVSGTVVSAGDAGDGWGISVKIRDANGNTHNYGHLSAANVEVGQQVAQGQVVGASGNTGKSTGPHLSYDVWDSEGTFIDPSLWVGGGAVNGRKLEGGNVAPPPGPFPVPAINGSGNITFGGGSDPLDSLINGVLTGGSASGHGQVVREYTDQDGNRVKIYEDGFRSVNEPAPSNAGERTVTVPASGGTIVNPLTGQTMVIPPIGGGGTQTSYQVSFRPDGSIFVFDPSTGAVRQLTGPAQSAPVSPAAAGIQLRTATQPGYEGMFWGSDGDLYRQVNGRWEVARGGGNEGFVPLELSPSIPKPPPAAPVNVGAGGGTYFDPNTGKSTVIAPIEDPSVARNFTAGENAAQRNFTAGENAAQRNFTAGENAAQRTFTAVENQANRDFQAQQDYWKAQVTAAENAATRAFNAGENEKGRQFQAQAAALQRSYDQWARIADSKERQAQFAATFGLQKAQVEDQRAARKQQEAKDLASVISSTDPLAFAAYLLGRGGGNAENAIAGGGDALSDAAVLPAARLLKLIRTPDSPLPEYTPPPVEQWQEPVFAPPGASAAPAPAVVIPPPPAVPRTSWQNPGAQPGPSTFSPPGNTLPAPAAAQPAIAQPQQAFSPPAAVQSRTVVPGVAASGPAQPAVPRPTLTGWGEQPTYGEAPWNQPQATPGQRYVDPRIREHYQGWDPSELDLWERRLGIARAATGYEGSDYAPPGMMAAPPPQQEPVMDYRPASWFAPPMAQPPMMTAPGMTPQPAAPKVALLTGDEKMNGDEELVIGNVDKVFTANETKKVLGGFKPPMAQPKKQQPAINRSRFDGFAPPGIVRRPARPPLQPWWAGAVKRAAGGYTYGIDPTNGGGLGGFITGEDQPYIDEIRDFRQGAQFPAVSPYSLDFQRYGPIIQQLVAMGRQGKYGIPAEHTMFEAGRFAPPGIRRGSVNYAA